MKYWFLRAVPPLLSVFFVACSTEPGAEVTNSGPSFLSNGVTAHRGNSGDFPENTIPAIESGIAVGADWVEIDILLTRDGQMVVTHDPSTEDVGDKSLIVAESTYEELQTVDVATSFRNQFGRTLEECPPQRIPLLREVLELIIQQPHTRLSIQPKADCVAQAVALVQELEAEPWVGFNDVSFDYMLQAKSLAPEVTIFWDRPRAGSDLDEDIRVANQHGFGTLVLHQSQVTPESIQLIHDGGLEVGVWTVNDPHAWNRFLDMGIDRFYTDFPRDLLSLKEARRGL